MARYLICGLGNPGSKYRGTRHNVGYMVVDELAGRHRMRLNQEKFDGHVADGRVAGARVTLLEPQTYMNRSGKAVSAAANFYKLDPEEIIVVHDDIDLEVGRLKVKSGGGHGGHNGLRDIVGKLGQKGFTRLRIGVGRPDHRSVSDWVLSRFSSEEQTVIDRVCREAADAIEVVLSEGPTEAQNKFNGRDLSQP